MADADQPKVVPPRNDFKAEPVFVKATIADQSGARPGYRRQWVEFRNEDHPNHVSKYLDERYVGDADIGHCKAEPWTVVQRKDAKRDHDGRTGRKRDDDTHGIDTGLKHGTMVCIETTEENARIFDKYKELKADRIGRQLGQGESDTKRADNGGQARFQARMGTGAAGDDPRQQVRNVLNHQGA